MFKGHFGNLQKSLVTVTPREVLGLITVDCQYFRIYTYICFKDERGGREGGTYPDVLVRVLDTLLQRRQVRPMLPMLVPENVCVDAGANKGGNANAA